MKRIITCILLLHVSIIALSQDKVAEELKALSDQAKYDKIIRDYTSQTAAYSAKALFYIGQAYYMKEDDKNCLKYINLSLSKDSTDPGPYFIKGNTLNYMGNYAEAIRVFQSAIRLKPDDPLFYSGMGDAYNQLRQTDQALLAYQQAATKDNCPERPFIMMGQIYSDRGEKTKALEAYYKAKEIANPASDSYSNALYNIGLYELLNDNPDKAEPAFLELINGAPDDYQSVTKLIQVYYKKKEYDKAKQYKEKLYEAHRKDLLKDNLKDMFCFDQFKWNDNSIQAYERYEGGKSKSIYNKHLFYILDKDNKILFRIQTEYSAISEELGGPKYLLCMSKENMHATYNVGFNDDLNYDDLKQAVINILEGKLKPAASSRTGG